MSLPSSNAGVVAPKKELLRGCLIAAAVAAVLLTVAVLPAEYGIDPTGAGKALGLTKLHSTAPSAGEPAAATAVVTPAPTGSTVSAPGEVRALTIASKQTVAYRADTQEITLAPGKGVEVKTHLAKGATLVFSWKTTKGEVLNHDFHGEPVNAKGDEFESFILEKEVSQSSGALIAPFTGVHGWYWKNTNDEPVTVVLQASGFYTDIFKK
ncbi:transmembrane anchor protein [Massilia sp. CCM 9210]|uniref:transmembrane anchor protein n=1 Tax=Massilia scottii TaxID=3057166 RepID=UPI002796A523|nr:transmembrane anchor protein [Massilia sp. CCM 9210]MDQ1813051.1 transmembrane anchor protein [Massilia sp. CCM 9210]